VAVPLVSIPEVYAQGQGLPPAVEVLFPAERSQPVNQTVTLPVYGQPVRYPFDRYNFTLQLQPRTVFAEGASEDGATSGASGEPPAGQQLFASIRTTAPRMTASLPVAVDTASSVEAIAAPRDLPSVRMTFSVAASPH
jgi:hypothetical protein